MASPISLNSNARQKWDRIHSRAAATPSTACRALRDYSFLLPASGRALDVACGRGGNALLLARRGLETSALDISPVALQALDTEARRAGLPVELIEADTEHFAHSGDLYDAIVVANYLDREFCRRLPQLLKPGGLLFYQTFVRDKVDRDCGPSNTDYLLQTGELLRLFTSLRVLQYSDLGTVGDGALGLRNQAMLIAMKENSDEQPG